MVRLTLLLSLALYAGCTPDFGGDYEYRDLSIDAYRRIGLEPSLALAGASDISYRQFGTRDSVEEWWRFKIPADRLDQIVSSCPNSSDAEWRNGIGNSSCPTSDDQPPPWWKPTDGSSAKMLRWCYPAGSAERHHGWYVTFDASTSFAYVWRWNHQWSSCDTTNGG